MAEQRHTSHGHVVLSVRTEKYQRFMTAKTQVKAFRKCDADGETLEMLLTICDTAASKFS